MRNILPILFLGLIGLLNTSFLTTTFIEKQSNNAQSLEAFYADLCTAYNLGENLMVVDENGTKYLNPNKKELQKLSPELFNQNRIRVTLWARSDNDLCSTELVIMDESGRLEGNYTINSCSSYGWIFFTRSDCFNVEIFHDAGLEAPYGSSINGSVDWTFQFNDQSKISGTYMDTGAANMFKVANPCYKQRSVAPISSKVAKKRVSRQVGI